MNRLTVSLRTLHAITLVALALCAASCRQPPQPAAAPERSVPPAERPIGALGHVEAGDGLVAVATRSLSGQPSIIGRLLVKDGDTVKTGQVLAELDSERQLAAAQRQAGARIDVARKRLAQVQAGAKASDLAVQQAEIERLQAELANAEQEYRRYASLGDNVTASTLGALRLRIDTATHALTGAKQRLASLTDVRPVDVDLARAELDEAIGNEARAAAEHAASVIHAPINGRVVKIYARAGEEVQARGVMELAPTETMYVVAEVTESDIARVKVGQRAKISGAGLSTPIQGTVERLAMTVLQNQLEPVDPASFSDARVVNVWIKLDDNRAVSNVIHLRVDVVIQP